MLMFFHNLQAAQITTFCFYFSNKKNVPVNVIEKTSKTPFKNWPIIRKKKRERNKEFLSVSSANHYSHPKKSGNWFNRSVTCLSSSWFHFRLQRERCFNVQLLWNQIWKGYTNSVHACMKWLVFLPSRLLCKPFYAMIQRFFPSL